MLDPTTIDRFATQFFGYGNLSAPLWFIGMEEGGLKDLDEFERRVQAWAQLGHNRLVDLVDFHQRIDVTRWFQRNAPLQPTWRPLIRIALAATGREASDCAQRSYQATRLGRSDGDTALLELLPFPSANTRQWPYADLGIDRYATRRNYRQVLREPRLNSILNLIETERPRVVVCYGNAPYWIEVLNLQPSCDEVSSGRLGETFVISTIHPGKHGSTNELWDSIGRMVRERLATYE